MRIVCGSCPSKSYIVTWLHSAGLCAAAVDSDYRQTEPGHGDQHGHRRDVSHFGPELESFRIAAKVLTNLLQFSADLDKGLLVILKRFLLGGREDDILLLRTRATCLQVTNFLLGFPLPGFE